MTVFKGASKVLDTHIFNVRSTCINQGWQMKEINKNKIHFTSKTATLVTTQFYIHLMYSNGGWQLKNCPFCNLIFSAYGRAYFD